MSWMVSGFSLSCSHVIVSLVCLRLRELSVGVAIVPEPGPAAWSRQRLAPA